MIKKAASGHNESFESLVKAYKGYVFAIILTFIRENEEAENVSQEVFLQIYISLPKFQEDNFKAWISRIATNKSIDYLRKKRSRIQESKLEDIQEIVIKEDVRQVTNPESLLIDKEKSEEIRREIEKLPQIYAHTIRKFYLEEKSYEEIALEDKVPIKTVESRIYRGRLLLKKKWRDKDGSL